MIISVWISTEQIIIIIFFPFHKNCNFLPARLFTCNWMHWCALSPFSLVLTSFSYGQYNAEFSTKLRREKKKSNLSVTFIIRNFSNDFFPLLFHEYDTDFLSLLFCIYFQSRSDWSCASLLRLNVVCRTKQLTLSC